MILYGDIETYSEIDLKQVGAQCYARHPSTELTLFAWAVGEGPVQVWDCTAGNMPVALGDAIRDADEYVFHNANFDRTVLLNNEGFKWHMSSRGSYMRPEKFHCTMIRAMAHGLPGALGTLGELYGLEGDEAKDKDGRRLVLKFCKPDKKGVRHTRETDPEDWAKFVSYAGRDVTAMRHLYKRLPRLNTDLPAEKVLIDLDRRINDRGLYIDMDLVRGAIAAVDREQANLRTRVQEQTDDMVESATKGAQLLAFILEEFGVRLPDLQASTLERRLEDDSIPEPVKELLRIRLEASRSSTAKYKVLARATTTDNRLRGLLQIYGAQRTGRFAGRLFQPTNLPRPSEKTERIEQNITAIKSGVLDLIHPAPMKACVNALRGVIIAPPEKKLVVADLSNIEGRMTMWLSGEEWKLQAFRDFDAGTGSDLYVLEYAKAMHVAPEVVIDNKKNGDGSMRQVGKVMSLALQFQGGAAAFLAFAKVYKLDLEALAAQARDVIPSDVLAEATDFYKFAVEKKFHRGMPEHVFAVCESLKRLWRAAHPNVVDFWSGCENAFRSALNNRGQVYRVGGKIAVKASGTWLHIRLPSGRALCYPQAREEASGELSYMGINQYTRKWERIKTYGGKLCLAAGTPVLTMNGWTRIENVRPGQYVWDGEEWVEQNGSVLNGRKAPVIKCHGAWMTPDHKVLTTEGWEPACRARKLARQPVVCPAIYRLPALPYAPKTDRPRFANVYDLMNCGPRHRFVVLGDDGPLIVHNCENLTQAAARDVLAACMVNAEHHGYEIVLTVHDELVTEAPDSDEFNADHLAAIMSDNTGWRQGLPLAAAGYEGYRYRKD